MGFFAVCQALVVPREVSSRAGETLSLRCWYPRGYEAYNKYWCRGASRDSCHKVVETVGREAPRQRGRVSIQDSHVFCVVLLTVEDVSEADAGSYWCGVERMGRDLMEPVTVRVVPGKPWCLTGWRFCWPGLFLERPLVCGPAVAWEEAAMPERTPVTQYKPVAEVGRGDRLLSPGNARRCRQSVLEPNAGSSPELFLGLLAPIMVQAEWQSHWLHAAASANAEPRH